jgi:hypothetical protein
LTHWAEYTTKGIVITLVGAYHGDKVAWFTGLNSNEFLTQVFHVPPFIEDAQQLTFALYMITLEPGPGAYDSFNMRFLNSEGNPFTGTEIEIQNNTSSYKNAWYIWTVDLTGMKGVEDQDIALQFESVGNASNNTTFYLDLVSLDVNLGHVYLPLAIKEPAPPPTPTPCGSHCGGHCGSHCGGDCGSYCPTDCGSYCGWDCYDCYSVCYYDWSW